MNINFTGMRALVGGSTQGIGWAAANELAHQGASVTLLARDEEKLQQCLSKLPAKNGQKHTILKADYADPSNLEKIIAKHVAESEPYSILVNNTGGPPGGPIASAGLDEFRMAFNQHLICNHILATALIPGMKILKYGRIINVISTSVKQPLRGLGVSNTIRAAVANWSKTLSVEIAPFGITVNNVLPGATGTQRLSGLIQAKAQKTGKSEEDLQQEMLEEIPAGRFASPEEVADAILFLASPSAAYINGINLPVDGGRTLCL